MVSFFFVKYFTTVDLGSIRSEAFTSHKLLGTMTSSYIDNSGSSVRSVYNACDDQALSMRLMPFLLAPSRTDIVTGR
jgi:hypothetical protein